MVEMRYVLRDEPVTHLGENYAMEVKVLQYRYLKIGVDASGGLCPNGGWSEWIDVPTVVEGDE